MSADTRPISPGRFAAALKDLSIPMLHLKVLEIRNSLAHLRYSNEQLKPFADGSATAIGREAQPARPDQDCIDAIRENEVVMDRMAQRIALIRAEVQERGFSWTEFMSEEEVEAATAGTSTTETRVNGHSRDQHQAPESHPAWTDGTFQTGTIRNGQVRFHDEPAVLRENAHSSGGRLDDEQLRRAIEERMRDLGENDDDEEGGMHL